MSVITYSRLLTESSIHYKGERRVRSVAPTLRKIILNAYKLKYTEHESMNEIIQALNVKALAMPVGTKFTVGNMVLSPNGLCASKLGRLWREHVTNGTDFKIISIPLTPGIYERLDTQTSLIQDFPINLDTFKEENHV